MKVLVWILVFGLCLSLPAGIFAQKRNSLVALPYAFYTPETKIAAGIGSIYSYRPRSSALEARPSNIRVALTFTQLEQMLFAVQPELYFADEKWLVNGTYNFYKYPDKFWGIGGNTKSSAEEKYTPKLLRTFTNVQRKVLPGLYAGIRFQLEYLDMDKYDPDGVLQYQRIPGSAGGTASGAGFLINWDTRNHTYYPTGGHYHQFYMVSFGSLLGSDFNFNMYTLDLRKYIALTSRQVLALHSYNIFISGTPPFQMMAMMGGSYWMRGYYFGRYRDKNMVTFQAEYRYPLFWRFGGVVFAGLGDVAGKPEQFQLSNFKTSLGAGIRFLFDKQEHINARLDFGMDNEGVISIYALVVEAF